MRDDVIFVAPVMTNGPGAARHAVAGAVDIFVPGRLCLFGLYLILSDSNAVCSSGWYTVCVHCLYKWRMKACSSFSPFTADGSAGEHSDWAGEYSRSHCVCPGRTIVIGTEQGLYCHARPLPQVHSYPHPLSESAHAISAKPFTDPEAVCGGNEPSLGHGRHLNVWSVCTA